MIITLLLPLLLAIIIIIIIIIVFLLLLLIIIVGRAHAGMAAMSRERMWSVRVSLRGVALRTRGMCVGRRGQARTRSLAVR